MFGNFCNTLLIIVWPCKNNYISKNYEIICDCKNPENNVLYSTNSGGVKLWQMLNTCMKYSISKRKTSVNHPSSFV